EATGTVDGGQALLLAAGAGNVTLHGAVGGVTPLASVAVGSAHDVTFGGAVNTSGDVTQSAGGGTTTFNGGGVGGSLSVATGAILLNSGTLAVGDTTTLDASTGGVAQPAGALTTDRLLLLGAGSFTLAQAGNDAQTLAADVAGPLTYADAN